MTTPLPASPAEALVLLTQTWGAPTRVLTAGSKRGEGLRLQYKEQASVGIDARLQALGASVQASTSAPTRRNGPNSSHMATGTFGTAVAFYLKATGIDQPMCSLDINLYPANALPGAGVDPVQLFTLVDAALGGEDEALALLPAYLSHHMLRLKGAQRFALCAELAQVVTDTLSEAAQGDSQKR